MKQGVIPGLAILFAAGQISSVAMATEPAVVTLTQVACQFLEAENGIDHGFETTKKADCDAINAESGEKRLREAEPIRLEAGDHVFRVTNKDVPYMLGFWLREKGYNPSNPVDKLTKTSVSGGGLEPGVTRDYEVTLEPGEYVYSCPLNTTPDYRLIVTE